MKLVSLLVEFWRKLPNRHEWWSFWGNGVRLAFTGLCYVSGTFVIMMGLFEGSKTNSLASLMPEALVFAFMMYVPITILMLFTRDPYVFAADPIWKLLSKHKEYAAKYLLNSGFVLMAGLLLVLVASVVAAFVFYVEWSEVVTTMYTFFVWPIIASALIVWHFQLLILIDEYETPFNGNIFTAEDSVDKNG